MCFSSFFLHLRWLCRDVQENWSVSAEIKLLFISLLEARIYEKVKWLQMRWGEPRRLQTPAPSIHLQGQAIVVYIATNNQLRATKVSSPCCRQTDSLGLLQQWRRVGRAWYPSANNQVHDVWKENWLLSTHLSKFDFYTQTNYILDLEKSTESRSLKQ